MNDIKEDEKLYQNEKQDHDKDDYLGYNSKI